MKIVYVYDAIARTGGVERILTDKMNYLAEVYGHEVYLITSAQGQHPLSFPLSSKVKHIDLDARFHIQYQYKYPKRLWVKWQLHQKFKKNFNKVIQAIEPDIIIGTTYYNADVICCLKNKAKKIIESHCAKSYTGTNDGIKRNSIMQLFSNINLFRYNYIIKKHSDAIVTLTQGDALEWNEPLKTYVIPNTITQIATTYSACENKKVIAIGRLTHQKGFDILINVWKQVNDKYPDWRLDIYGRGELENDLKQQIKTNGLEDVITIPPPTPHIYEGIQKSSIFVFPSRYEGFGLVLIEAMTNGVPCVSFDCPYGPSDIITDGEDGFLVPNRDIQTMANKICFLIENKEVRKDMGRKAHQSAMRYAPENIMPMWEKLFKEIVKS